jgi:hypothetical protein
MWAAILALFAVALVAVLIAAGGVWLIAAVPVAVFVLLPASLIGLRHQFEAATTLRKEIERQAATGME